MANSTLNIKLTDATNCTVTIVSSSYPEAQTYAQSITKGGGFWDDAKNWHPSSAILTISIS